MRKQQQKDNTTQFEEARDKKVENHLNASSLCVGPILSTDKVNLTYIYNSTKPIKEMTPSKGKGGDSSG